MEAVFSRSLQLKRTKRTKAVVGEGAEGGQRLRKSLDYSRRNLNMLLHKGKVRKGWRSEILEEARGNRVEVWLWGSVHEIRLAAFFQSTLENPQRILSKEVT